MSVCCWLSLGWYCVLLVNQEQPDEIVRILTSLGVDAYRGATQLNVIESDNGSHDHMLSQATSLDRFVTRYPHEARYLIDHVVYLPVNKSVPFHELDRICHALSVAMSSAVGRDSEIPHPAVHSNVRLKSKLWCSDFLLFFLVCNKFNWFALFLYLLFVNYKQLYG